ncbi:MULTISPECIES: acyl-CoA thioesterase [Maribacter]|uniref:Acyl-CoA thioesterase n=1 Tax=Maribacter flavus TaxID=1658664 RepID=A0A5B2TSE0_9FLAO|nr:MULTISPECIES: thioesterase family protein [Maribacter]KAA2217043.1 acyl-CoA thioesterase [Maribacter flavus]MDC6405557.1 thioesterase family protein [Maribacter sp. PR66]MEE1972675.1 thioesterase family protein [Maribacter flavus]
MPFTKRLKVSVEDLDDLNHVNNVRYVQWIQDISKEHWKEKAPVQIQDSVIWVVLKHTIEYKSPAILNDPILISTYIEKSKGAISVRIVEMFHEITNTLLVRSHTEWCLLNKDTNKPMRISEDIKKIFS